MIDYWELRKIVSKIIPRRTQLMPQFDLGKKMKEKGRKSNYQEFNLRTQQWDKKERLLNLEEYPNFVEISLRAAACPMPLNVDIWDGKNCVAEGEKVKVRRTDYLVTDIGDIPIEDVAIGDEVLSFNESTHELEWKEVTDANSIEKEDMVEIETKVGTLLVTEDHPVYTQRGWVLAGDLTERDILLTYGTD